MSAEQHPDQGESRGLDAIHALIDQVLDEWVWPIKDYQAMRPWLRSLSKAAGEATAERDRLKGTQRWRAVGGDSGGTPDCEPWRNEESVAVADASEMRAMTKPPYEDVWIETCWMSEPERCVASDERRNNG